VIGSYSLLQLVIEASAGTYSTSPEAGAPNAHDHVAMGGCISSAIYCSLHETYRDKSGRFTMLLSLSLASPRQA
jgi:hypothetical protein